MKTSLDTKTFECLDCNNVSFVTSPTPILREKCSECGEEMTLRDSEDSLGLKELYKALMEEDE